MLTVFNDNMGTDYLLNQKLEELKNIICKNIENKQELSEINFYHFIRYIRDLDEYKNIDIVIYHIIDFILSIDTKHIYTEVEVVETVLYYYNIAKLTESI